MSNPFAAPEPEHEDILPLNLPQWIVDKCEAAGMGKDGHHYHEDLKAYENDPDRRVHPQLSVSRCRDWWELLVDEYEGITDPVKKAQMDYEYRAFQDKKMSPAELDKAENLVYAINLLEARGSDLKAEWSEIRKQPGMDFTEVERKEMGAQKAFEASHVNRIRNEKAVREMEIENAQELRSNLSGMSFWASQNPETQKAQDFITGFAAFVKGAAKAVEGLPTREVARLAYQSAVEHKTAENWPSAKEMLTPFILDELFRRTQFQIAPDDLVSVVPAEKRLGAEKGDEYVPKPTTLKQINDFRRAIGKREYDPEEELKRSREEKLREPIVFGGMA